MAKVHNSHELRGCVAPPRIMGCFFIGGRKGAVERRAALSPLDRYIVAIMGAENVGHAMNYAAVGGSALTRDLAPWQD